jgi:hypothetical protein
VLTSEDRTTWAKARQHLIDCDASNRTSLELIETALFVVALDRDSPRTLEERSSVALLGTGQNRWWGVGGSDVSSTRFAHGLYSSYAFRYDKPFTIIVYANGLSSINGEHTWADAMVVVKQQVERVGGYT